MKRYMLNFCTILDELQVLELVLGPLGHQQNKALPPHPQPTSLTEHANHHVLMVLQKCLPPSDHEMPGQKASTFKKLQIPNS